MSAREADAGDNDLKGQLARRRHKMSGDKIMKNTWINDYPKNVPNCKIYVNDGVEPYCKTERIGLREGAEDFASTYDHNDVEGWVYIEVTIVRGDGSFGRHQGFRFNESGSVQKTSSAVATALGL